MEMLKCHMKASLFNNEMTIKLVPDFAHLVVLLGLPLKNDFPMLRVVY